VSLIECVAAGNVENHDDAMRTPVVRLCDGAELLVPGSVPDLEPYRCAIDRNELRLEIDADRRHESFLEFVICVTKEETALARR
jgi:hypothetical protein